MRICLGLREKKNEAIDTNFDYKNSDQYDIIQLSMKTFTVPAQQWSVKDGMTFNPSPSNGGQTIEENFREFCQKPWKHGLELEPDVDWENQEVELPYDANNRQLNAKFSRKLVGQSANDYTYRLDTDYDYIITLLVADKDTSDESSKGGLAVQGGAENGLTSLRTLKFDQAFNDSAMGRFGSGWMAVGSVLMLLGWQ